MKLVDTREEVQVASYSGYPKLMKHKYSDFVVLFYANRTGVVISKGQHHEIGTQSDCWLMDTFVEYYGKITLESLP